jgi:hypothetical protein
MNTYRYLELSEEEEKEILEMAMQSFLQLGLQELDLH